MTTTMKRIAMAGVLVLALVGALFLGSTVYRVSRTVSLLDEADLRFLHQARVTVEAQPPAPAPKPAVPKPPEGTP